MKNSNAIATTYDLVIGNRRIRKATKVTFADGRVVEFMDLMPKGEAIRQAEVLAR